MTGDVTTTDIARMSNRFALALLSCPRDQAELATARLIQSVEGTPIRTARGPCVVRLRIGAVALQVFSQAFQQPERTFDALVAGREHLERRLETGAGRREQRVLVAHPHCPT